MSTNILTDFTEDPLNHAHLGSDHDLISGSFTSLFPGYRSYSTPDWDPWRDYIDKEKPFLPRYQGDAYKELLRLHNEFSRVKNVGYRFKKWWDEEVSEQLRKVRTADHVQYPLASKALKKLIQRKKREC